MLKDIKLGMKLLRYSYNFKTNIGFMIFFLVLGGGMMLLPQVNSFLFGGTYIFIGYIMMLQMNYTLMFAQMVPATPHRKMFELTFPNFMTLTSAVLWYLVLTVMVMVLSDFRPALRGEYNVALVLIAIYMAIIIIYAGICYKFLWLAFILFTASFSYVYILGKDRITVFFLRNVGADLPANFAVGLVIVVVGCLLSALLRKIFYKKAMSESAMSVVLRKAMK